MYDEWVRQNTNIVLWIIIFGYTITWLTTKYISLRAKIACSLEECIIHEKIRRLRNSVAWDVVFDIWVIILMLNILYKCRNKIDLF